MPRHLTLVMGLAAALAWAAGCGAPPEWHQSSPPPPPPATGAPTHAVTPAHPATATPVGEPTSTGEPEPTPTAAPTERFGDTTAVPCAGHPTAGEIIGVLRAEGLLTAGAAATVTRGPLCAGSWQYAVVSVAERDPLQVVTAGTPGTLTLVTAGTEVCTVEVRVTAPPGIRTAAACVG